MASSASAFSADPATGPRSARALFLTAASAALYAASLPPLSLGPLAWVALVPLLAAVGGSSAGGRVRPIWLGAFWGAGVGLLTGWPLAGMLSRHLDVSPVVGGLAFVPGAALLFAMPSAVWTAWVGWTIRRRGSIGPFEIAAGWGTYEAVRYAVALEIPWSFLATTQAVVPWVRQVADIGGAPLVGMIVALANGVAAGALVREFAGRHPLRSRAAAAAVLVATLLYGVWRIEAEEVRDGEAIHIAVVQGGNPPGAGGSEDRLAEYLDLSRTASSADLVFWPEFAVDFLPIRLSVEQRRLLDGVRSQGIDLIFGGPHESVDDDDIVHLNAAFAVHDGHVSDWYEKERPLWFTEHETFGLRSALGLRSYAAGTRVAPLDVRGGPVGVLLCSEVMNAGLARRRVAQGARILANPSNDFWMGADSAMQQQLAISSLRAVESRRYLARATTTGYSAVIDPTGEVIARSDRDTAGVLEADIYAKANMTIYQRFGDVAEWIAILMTFASTLRTATTAPRAGSRT